MKRFSKIFAIVLTRGLFAGAIAVTASPNESTSPLDASQYGTGITNITYSTIHLRLDTLPTAAAISSSPRLTQREFTTLTVTLI